jgi:methylglyoxal synthase
MAERTETLPATKRIALVAHDNKKFEMVAWVKDNREKLSEHELFATGNTGELLHRQIGLNITRFKSGPIGGDQQIGARIAQGEIDCLIFFWDPLESAPHDPDVKALLRMAAIWNIPAATNRATAEFLISSPQFDKEYKRPVSDYRTYRP